MTTQKSDLKRVEEYTDEELEEYLSKQGYVRATPAIYWLCDTTAIAEIVRRYENKKNECERKDKLADQRVKRQVQLATRNMELKEQIYKVLQILSPHS